MNKTDSMVKYEAEVAAIKKANTEIKAGRICFTCPLCKSSNLTTGQMQTEFQNIGLVWQEVQCMECHADWQDTYKLCSIYLHQ